MKRLSSARLLAVALALLTLAGVAHADVVSGGNVRVTFHGWIAPRKLPRGAPVPIALHVAGKIDPVGNRRPPQLLRVTVAINRHAVVSTRGLPTCPMRRLLSSTTEQARALCRGSLVGSGHFSAHVDIPEQAPFPAVGRLLAFNTVIHGHRALVAHVYGTDPLPIGQVLPMRFQTSGHGQFGAVLSVKMPEAGADWGFVTGFDMTFHRLYRSAGEQRSFISASCPAPSGFPRAPFKAARGTYYLDSGRTITRILSRTCLVGDSPTG